jgi:exopolysaccharide biosynthesis polyprenyl glycosylphosphotransferase
MSESRVTDAPPRAALEALSGGSTRTRRRRPLRRLVLGQAETPQLGITEAQPSAPVLFREGAYRRALALADIVAAGCGLAVAVLLSGGTLAQPALPALAALLVVVNKLSGLYDRDDLVLNKTTLDEAPALLQLSGLFALIVWLVHEPLLSVTLAPAEVLALWSSVVFLLVGGRAAARRGAAAVSAPERCLLVGTPATMRGIEEKLEIPRVHAKVVARIAVGDGARLASVADRLRELSNSGDVHRIIIAPHASDGADTLELIRAAKAAGLRVSVLPRLLEVVGSSVTVDQIDGLTMLGIRSFGLTRSSRLLKRGFDVVGATILLVAVAPLMAGLALAVRLGSPGPIFFRQTRVGRDGETFEILKFRSMSADAEERKDGLAHLNETEGLFKISKDPRVNAVGRFLRATSLDELPQLLNVWRGEMSIVGPRPLVVDEDAKVGGHDRSRLHLTPGMTGHWQILGSARVPLGEMVGIDYLYVANWSLWTDIKILIRTVPYVLSRGGV